MPRLTTEVTIKVNGYEDAQRLALAVQLLRMLGVAYGNDDVVRAADHAQEALENLDVTTEHKMN